MTGSVLPRRRLGRRLRESRCAAGLTIAEAAERMQWSFTMLQRVEKGQVDKVRDVDVRELCRIYEVDPDDLIGLSHEENAPAWWRDFADLLPERFDLYLGLESAADRLAIHQSEVVPEVLRTARYERTLAHGVRPAESAADLRRWMRLRGLRREPFFRETDPVRAEFVLDEAVLRRVVGSRAVMAAQCSALAEFSSRTNLSIKVLPFTAGFPANHPVGSFTILDFGKDSEDRRVEPTVVRLETFTTATLLDKPSAVAAYENAFATVEAAALDAEASRERLAEFAREFANDS
ncbi:helix-turn-helix domain-containing protein [Nocardia takedensis]|uniref:helix-turn-helix domain-containing protein n=1 Tax=Nocardia takedensis TaxID=259390 RepID=UPI000593540B|nr:helix-turn-helix transcriptional regulator [Nocardia takedensis]